MSADSLREAVEARDHARYRGRERARLWLAFDTTFEAVGEWLVGWAELLSGHLRPPALEAPLGVTLTVLGEEAALPDLARGRSIIGVDTLWVMEALRTGALLRVRGSSAHVGEVVLVHRPDGDPRLTAAGRRQQVELLGTPPRLVPVELQASLPAPPDGDARGALAALMDGLVRSAVLLESCIGACALAEGVGPLPAPFAHERLVDTVGVSNRLRWIERHPRAPGWRTLIPRRALAGRPPPQGPGVHTAAGYLMVDPALDPFWPASDGLRQIEAGVLPFAGDAAEAAQFLLAERAPSP